MSGARSYTKAEREKFKRIASGVARDVDHLVELWNAETGRNLSRGAVDSLMRSEGITAYDVVRSHAAAGGDGAELRQTVRDLKAENRDLQERVLTDERVKREILGLKEADGEPPKWMIEPKRGSHSPGVPVLFATDWHFGEVVSPSEIGGVNRYDLAIAKERAQAFFANAIDLLTEHMTTPEYPGVVLAMGGDMVSGDIHEELSLTNEVESMPALLELRKVMRAGILALRKRWPLFVVGVTGNHARTSTKPRHKRRNFSNYDWLLYSMLAGDFEDDKDVRWLIPDGPDALWQVFGHRFLLTHGDQFRGGDGIIGALGPILRGDTKKRSRQGQIDQGYDTLMLGHWHQLIQMQRVIVGGTLKGYDEYAYAINAPFEPPRQALFIVHPDHGITFSIPLIVSKQKARRLSSSWISWQEAA